MFVFSSILLFAIFILVIVPMFAALHTKKPERFTYNPPKIQTAQEKLRELKAQEELERNYFFVVPEEHGYFMGKKIMEPTDEMLSDIRYLRAKGKYVKRDSIKEKK